ncbi:MAG TPA: DUF424 family protein [Candidatus Nanoarchaeia archaeon]|nr:DUF424 family protein [Candidatus Nanoarchaeia archaeon]
MFVRIIKSYRNLAVFCDENLIGKSFEEGEFKLYVKEDFFKGESVSVERAKEIMKDMSKEDATFNIVGEESVKAAIDSEIIKQEDIKKIQGVSYSMILL